jgi:hypothetical protein
MKVEGAARYDGWTSRPTDPQTIPALYEDSLNLAGLPRPNCIEFKIENPMVFKNPGFFN